MPGFDVLADDDHEPLFASDDPLVFTLPDIEGGAPITIHACDDPVLPDDSQYGIDTRPRSYLIELVSAQAIEEERGKVRNLLPGLMDTGLVRESHIMELMKFLTEQRDTARKAQSRRKLRRPTGAPSPS